MKIMSLIFNVSCPKPKFYDTLLKNANLTLSLINPKWHLQNYVLTFIQNMLLSEGWSQKQSFYKFCEITDFNTAARFRIPILSKKQM